MMDLKHQNRTHHRSQINGRQMPSSGVSLIFVPYFPFSDEAHLNFLKEMVFGNI